MGVLTSDSVIRSADSHVLEPGDLWVERVAEKYRDRAPKIVNEVDTKAGRQEGEWLVCDGIGPQRVASFAAADVEDPKWRTEANARGYEQLLSGGWDPAQRMKDQDIDGVSFEAIYPSMTMPMFGIPDSDFQYSVLAAYNDWISEYVGHDPKRMLGIGLICVDDLDRAVEEIARCAKLGLRGIMIPVDPGEPNYADPRYDPIWAAACDHDMPISLHILMGRHGTGLQRTPFLMAYVTQIHEVQVSLAAILVSGVFHRYPKLKIVSVENDIGWIPHFLYKLTHGYDNFRYMIGYEAPKSPMDYMRSNVWFTFQDDPVGCQHLEEIGADQVMWASDYPHGDSTWPYSRETIERNFAGLSADLISKAITRNVANLYGI